VFFTISSGLATNQNLSIFNQIDDLMKCPIHNFELFGFPEHIDIKDEGQLNELKKISKKYKFHFESIHAPSWGNNGEYDLSNPNAGLREKAIAWHLAAIKAAKIIKANYVIIHGGDKVNNYKERGIRLENSVKSIKVICKEAEKINIALENILDPYVPCNLKETLFLLSEIKSPMFHPIFDVGHAFLSDGLEPWYEAGKDFRFIAVHVTDNHGRIRNTSNDDEHLFPGRGIIPWEEVFNRLRGIGFDGPVTLECPIDNKLFAGFRKLVIG